MRYAFCTKCNTRHSESFDCGIALHPVDKVKPCDYCESEKHSIKDCQVFNEKFPNSKGFTYVVVLNDGETYTEVEDCVLLKLKSATVIKMAEQGLSPKDLDDDEKYGYQPISNLIK